LAVLAVQQIKRMRGGAQGQMMFGADGKLWVVKFRNNPQHVRVLANEMLGTRLAEAAGLTVPQTAVVEVSGWLIANTPGMEMRFGGYTEPCAAGLQFGARYVGGTMPGQVIDYLPEAQMGELRNFEEFAGMLALDKWTGNVNGRQAVYVRRQQERRYKACFIDQGYCFHAGEWRFEDVPLRGTFPRNPVYAHVRGWESFEPWLTRMERMEPAVVWRAAEEIPAEWCGVDGKSGDLGELERLVETVIRRRSKIRECIEAFGRTDRKPFPQWVGWGGSSRWGVGVGEIGVRMRGTREREQGAGKAD